MSLIMAQDDSQLQKMIAEESALLLTFSSPTCVPCKQMEPRLDNLSSEPLSTTFIKADVTLCPRTATQFMVRSVPTMLLIKSGKVLRQWVGLIREDIIRQDIVAMKNRS